MTNPIDEIVEAAEGEIDKDLLTQTGEGGILSNGYLHTKPLIEYLGGDETLAYLFDNLKKGIEPHRDGKQQTVTPDSNYRAIIAITSKRILSVIGQADGDEVIVVPFSSVVTATAHSGFRTDRLEIETVDGTIDFYLRSDPETVDAADYINQRLGESATEQETSQSIETVTQSSSKTAESDTTNADATTADGGSDVATEHQNAGKNADTTPPQSDHSPTTEQSQSPQDEGDSLPVAYIDQTAASDNSPNLVREAEALVQDVGTDIEDIEDAREQLTRAHNKLCRVLSADDPGVNEAELDQRVVDIEKRLDALEKAAQILSNAQDLDVDAGDEKTRKIRLYRRAISAAEDVGLSLPAVETALTESPNAQAATATDSEGGDEPTDTSASNQSKPADSTIGPRDTEPQSGKRAEMIAEIESVADELGRIPRYGDMHEHGTFKAQDYSQEFGSWDQALQATDLELEQRLIDALKSVGDKLGRAPTRSDVDAYGDYDSNWYYNHFDDFEAALDAAGLQKPDGEALLDELYRLEDELGCPPTSHHVDQHGQYPVTFYRKAFDSVRKAAEQARMDYEAAVIDAIRAIAVSLKRRPKSAEFDEYAQYSSSYVYNYFDGWREACEAAGVGSDDAVTAFISEQSASEVMELFERAPVTDDPPRSEVDTSQTETSPTKEPEDPTGETTSRRAELLAKLEEVADDLGRVPSYSDMYDYDGVDPVEYTQTFGSWKRALKESSIDVRAHLLAALEDLADELGRAPKWSELDEQGSYDARWYSDYFDSLEDAFSQAGLDIPFETASDETTEQEGADTTVSDGEPEVEASPLAEYYEVFGNLESVQTALLGDDLADRIGEAAPMTRWYTLVRDRWAGDTSSSSTVGESYGSQQNDRTDVAMPDYREEYGNGDLVTEFQTIETAPLPASATELLWIVAGMDDSEAAEVRLPKAPDSDVPLPVFVESEAEYERAKTLLEEFPDRPSTTIDSDGQGRGPQEAPESDTPEEGEQPEPAPEPDDELTELGGITPSIAAALRNAGYESKDDLREADTEDLTDVDGVDSQKANRIKLVVGG